LLIYFLKTDIHSNRAVTAYLKQLTDSGWLSDKFRYAAHKIINTDVPKIIPCHIANSRTNIIDFIRLCLITLFRNGYCLQ